jgi:hypothetical protein
MPDQLSEIETLLLEDIKNAKNLDDRGQAVMNYQEFWKAQAIQASVDQLYAAMDDDGFFGGQLHECTNCGECEDFVATPEDPKEWN